MVFKINLIKILAAGAISVGAAIIASAQTPVTPEQRAEANSLFQAQDWIKSAAAYEKIVESEPTNANAHFRLGASLLNLNKNSEAQTHLEKAFAGNQNPIIALALARCFARNNKVY